MCAISGIFGNADSSLVERMNEVMAHRGPDDAGVYVDDGQTVALGHRRLSIIDPGDGGHQPVLSRDGRWCLVFNGEIYNYRDLRAQLVGLGHAFRSDSDTEVLLAAWMQWHEACLSRLDGMFAFAIHDRDSGALCLVRDRLGIKPLYWCERDGDVLFASEVKALLASGRVARTMDIRALGHYLSLGAMPQPATAIDGVQMLAPGSFLRLARGRDAVTTRWWDLAQVPAVTEPRTQGVSRGEAGERVRGLLEAATRRHLVADVDVGAFLSGGMDSSAVVALMSPLHSSAIKTFSVGFDHAGDVDERAWARQVAERYGTAHQEVVVSADDVAAQFDNVIAALDQPSLDGTNTWLVSRAAGASMKVALSGAGGDELFGGYEHFRALPRAECQDKRLGMLSPRLRRLVNRLLPTACAVDSSWLGLSRAQRFATLRNLQPGGAFANDSMRAQRERHPLAEIYAPWLQPPMGIVRQISYVEIRGYLLNTLLRDIDAMSMAHSLEVRPVLLDHHLVEYVFALPGRLKLSRTANKPILADAMRDRLPADLLARKKIGFELPLMRWLNGALRDRARSAFASSTARSVFANEFLRRTDDELRAGRCASPGVWAWFALIEWMQAQRCTVDG